MTATAEPDIAELNELRAAHQQIRDQISRQIIGQDEVVDQLLIAVFARGHCILEGVPGLAKTLMVQSLAQSLSLEFNRIQFTPDLMPSDITGTEVLYEDRKPAEPANFGSSRGRCSPTWSSPTRSTGPRPRRRPRSWKPCRSGRSPPAASVHKLPDPFFVLATQNPIEQEGTYALARGPARPVPVQDLHQVSHAAMRNGGSTG